MGKIPGAGKEHGDYINNNNIIASNFFGHRPTLMVIQGAIEAQMMNWAQTIATRLVLAFGLAAAPHAQMTWFSAVCQVDANWLLRGTTQWFGPASDAGAYRKVSRALPLGLRN